MSGTQLEERVLESLDRSLVAYNEGKQEFFDEFAKDAMIFTAESKDPIRGRDDYRAKYLQTLTAQKRQKTILGRNMQVVGDKAVVALTARIEEGEATVDVSQTIVYGLTDEGLKVLQMHTAPLRAAGNGSTVDTVNEQISPVASVLGVAQ